MKADTALPLSIPTLLVHCLAHEKSLIKSYVIVVSGRVWSTSNYKIPLISITRDIPKLLE